MGIIETWTLVAVILHFCGIEYFANLPVIDWPWHWSCMCLFIWVILLYIVLFILFVALKFLSLNR